MLDLLRYLLGILEIALFAGFATLAATSLRRRLLPDFDGAPAHLATVVLALALLTWVAEILGSFSFFEPAPYLVCVIAVGVGVRLLVGEVGGARGSAASCFSQRKLGERRNSQGEKPSTHPDTPDLAPRVTPVELFALLVAVMALVKFGLDAKPKLTTGMTGFDSTWYHGPFAAGFFQSGDTWSLHFIAPQFLAWFYPANAEIFHAVGMGAFGRDLLSPLLNIGWFFGCLAACWCIGRPYRVAPWSLALGAVALSLPVLTDQAGEARNDIVGIFFLLAAVAIAVNAWSVGTASGANPSVRSSVRIATKSANATIVVGLAAGLAAGTKLNFLLPAAVLVLGLPMLAPAGRRLRALIATILAALAGGGYWYLRNLIHTGNPLPWFDNLGPISLPAPDQPLGGREGHTVLSYLTDGAVWSDWFLPGLHDGLTLLWPLLGALALAGLLLSLFPLRGSLFTPGVNKEPRNEGALRIVGLAGLAAVLAWLIAPTSASGPDGMPRGFESGLRYLAPALVLGLALVPVGFSLRFRRAGMGCPPNGRILKVPRSLARHLSGRGAPHTRSVVLALIVIAVVTIGYPVQRHYLQNRYTNPTFAAPGLNAAFAWSRSISNARIATTSTRQYPLYGTDLSNKVQFIGEHHPHGGFTAPTTCPQWRRLLNAGNYDYAVTTRDRLEPGKPPYPPTARWTSGVGAEPILQEPPTVVFKLTGPLDPAACR